MVPAGPVVDETMKQLRPLLDEGDLIIDAGNANFEDTNRRAAAADNVGELFLGIGVSGGEEGARHGPSIMGGGTQKPGTRVRHPRSHRCKYRGRPVRDMDGAGRGRAFRQDGP